MKLRFTDGMEIDTSGPIRPQCRRDGWYVVGAGMCIPAEDGYEAQKIAREMNAEKDSRNE